MSAALVNTAFTARELRDTLGAFVTGVTVVTTVDETGRPHGLTVSSFNSVSLNPPLILWSQSLSAPSYPVFRDAERFAISILAEHQVGVSQQFAQGKTDKFAGVAVDPGLGGIPLIRDAAAHLECRRVTSYPGGDHAVFMGEVERLARSPARPLAFGGGKYLVTSSRDLGEFSLDIGVSSLDHLRAIRAATPVVVDLAARLQHTVALATWGNMGPTVIRWEESTNPVSVNLRTGVVLPILTSATGLAFAAHLPRALTQDLIDRERQDGKGLPLGEAALEALFAAQRASGLGCVADVNRFPDMYESAITALSAPVFARDGLMVLAITVVGHGGSLDADPNGSIGRMLRDTAASLSANLGFTA